MQRAGVQGLSDVIMGVRRPPAGALAGVVVDLFGFATLSVLAGDRDGAAGGSGAAEVLVLAACD